jgi:hypothetical protein
LKNVANSNKIIWIEAQPQRPLCDVPWIGNSIILDDGRVHFCCFSYYTPGNVNEKSFEDIWNGSIMQGIRQALSEQRLPPECQAAKCPIYRGDDSDYIIERMEGSYSYKVTKKHDPHRCVRELFHGSKLQVNHEEVLIGDILKVSLEFHYLGDSIVADLFVGIRYPDGVVRFLPNYEEYAVPFRTNCEFNKEQNSREFKVFEQTVNSLPSGCYQICSALFVNYSNPNLISNCYWSANKTVNIQ